MGFVLENEEAQLLLENDPKNRHVILPFSNGDDITSRHDQSPSRWVINFFDWTEQEARKYSDCWQLIEERVKPERQRKKPDGSFQLRTPLPQRYWLYGDSRRRFLASCGDLKKIIVAVQTSKYVAPCFQPNNRVFSQALVMIASDDSAMLAVLNSSLHREWISATCSSLETRLRYLVSDGFNTFPFPELTMECRNEGARLHKGREAYLARNSVGLTEAYNRLNDENWNDQEIDELRKTFAKIDQAALRAYGWDDINLDHAFREVHYLPESDRIRFTISESARIEVLRRLAELNRKRHEEEAVRGLQRSSTVRPTSSARRATNPDNLQPGFDFETRVVTTANGTNPTEKVLGFLRSHEGWHAKTDVLAATGITDGQWNAAISDLISNGRVERQGEKRGACYRIQPGYRDDDSEGMS
jgi:hypothetical protein